MSTNRIPIRRPALATITPRALELFERLERARRMRKGAACIIGDSPLDYCSADCQACQDWYDVHGEIHTELRLKPWQGPASRAILTRPVDRRRAIGVRVENS
jgi:hypothetical protein